MLETEAGMVMPAKEVQPKNAASPIVVTEAGITTLVRPVHAAKA
jgi:hypothetical protein